MSKTLLTLIVLFASAFTCKACLNGEFKTLKNNYLLYQDRDGNVPLGRGYFTGNFPDYIKDLDSLYRKTKDIDYLSDKGLLLILLKQYDEALIIYKNIEKTNPGRYSTASNLGTLYELIGDNEKALKWIHRALEINPDSHDHSEWIHERILKTKIRKKNNISSDDLINWDFGTDPAPKKYNKAKLDLARLYIAIYYQLNERVFFIEPKDPIVAQLYFDLGNIAFLIGEYSDAAENYRWAAEYGMTDPLLQTRINTLKALNKKATPNVKPKPEFNYMLLVYGAMALFALAFMFRIGYKKGFKKV